MASDKSFAGEKSEEATPRRLEEARKKGQVAKSSDVNSALNIFGVVLIIFFLQGYYSRVINGYFTDYFGHSILAGTEDIPTIFLDSGIFFVRIAGPVLLGAFVIGLISNFIQFGFLLSAEPLKPKFDRLDLIQGLGRIFSAKTMIDLVKNLIKMAAVSWVLITVVKSRMTVLFRSAQGEIPEMVNSGKQIITAVFGAVVITFLAIALLDYLYQRYEFKKGLRMTKQEVKEEYKQIEGDPHLKARQKERQRQIASRRMMQEVPKATVVVTNPTHYAAALKYKKGETAAPLVVAKGVDMVAEKIKETARKNNVPIIENKPVAQFLWSKVETGDSIPEELYQAVAEILAVVYQKYKGTGL